jgi:glycosyltransferase involved in cell wall biosynthesis
MIQSGFFKKPFISSNVDGIGETIVDGFNGLLFTKGDSAELADRIMKYYQDVSLMSRCAGNLYELVNEKHLPADNVKKIYELYNSLLRQ